MIARALILRAVTTLLAPAILLFGLYVQFHGDYGPGGGFQAGVIFAMAFILHALVFGAGAATRMLPIKRLHAAMAVGVLLYSFTGVAGMLMGGTFLDYAPLAEPARAGRHIGVFLVELGVGITVAGVVVSVFHAFSSSPRSSAKTTKHGGDAP